MLSDYLRVTLKKKLVFSLILHVLHGFIFEKSKLYYPYTFSRNLLLIRTDLYKYYLSASFIFLGSPYLLRRINQQKYTTAYLSIRNRYLNRTTLDIQIGTYCSAISLLFTGFCSSYLPIYLAISPTLFLSTVVASYTAFISYQIIGKHLYSRLRTGSINNDANKTPSIPNENTVLANVQRVVILLLCILALLILESIEVSVSSGHSSEQLLDLVSDGDYLPPGLTGVLCGIISFLLIFFCDEYQALTSEWLINLFYYSSAVPLKNANITGSLCAQQILKVISMAVGVRLSFWTSARREMPNIDWLFFFLTVSGSFFGSISICLTTATFTDHIYLISALAGSVSPETILLTVGSSWFLIYLIKLL